MTEKEEKIFEYEFLVANKIAILSFKGDISKAYNAELERCLVDISSQDAIFFVLNFKRVEKIDSNGFRFIAMLQKKIRDNGGNVFHCYVEESQWRELNSQGILKENERKKDLIDAIKALKELI